ncbi:MAG: hypothetical protein IJZ47_08015 [Oscillospiraceae bacterium]|nr:hypothetical protein [Oscillospiraceae bacterium]
MAISLLRKNYETQACQFVVDNESEVALLPTLTTAGQIDPLKRVYACGMGSIAKITGADGVYYVLTGENKWVKKTVSGGGGSSGGGGDYDYVTPDDIDDLFPAETNV